MIKNRPLIRYVGSKWTLAPKIIKYIPDVDTYNEPFAGSASVLLRKPRSPLEAINDASGDLWNMLVMFRDRRDELIERIEYTYYSEAEFRLSLEPCEDPLERARRFYTRHWMSIRPYDNNPSFRRQKKLSRGRNGDKSPMGSAAKLFTEIDHLYLLADRLRGVTIENMDAFEFIERYAYQAAFFYCDPPYLKKTRRRGTAVYDVDWVDEIVDDEERLHLRLFEMLHNRALMAIISHYPCDLYADTYEVNGWHRVDLDARIDGGGSATESIYISPTCWDALGRGNQLQLL